MALWRLILLTGVLMVASSSACFGQCQTSEMDENVAYLGKGGIGTVCTTDYEQTDKLCIKAGKIASYDFDIVDENNMEGTTELRQLDDQCIEARTSGHAKEASRTPNGYLCKPAERTILVHIAYCP
jgi:hypothetical protein